MKVTFRYREFLTTGGTEYAAVCEQRVDRPGDPDPAPVISLEVHDGPDSVCFDLTPLDAEAYSEGKELLWRLQCAVYAAETALGEARAGWEAEADAPGVGDPTPDSLGAGADEPGVLLRPGEPDKEPPA